MKIISFSFCLFCFFVGCASSPKPEASSPERTKISAEVFVPSENPASLSEYEKQAQEALERYRQLRLLDMGKSNWPPKRELPKPPPTYLHLKSESTEKMDTPEIVITVSPPVSNEPKEPTEEQKMEISQNISFYCIKHEARFKEQGTCQAFAERLLQECEARPGRDLVKCFKASLKSSTR